MHGARHRTMLVGRLVAPAVAIAGSATPALAQSCAMCGSALADDPLGRAFSWSVLFLMAAPYTIVGLAGAWLFYMYRRPPGRRGAAIIHLVRTGRLRRPAPADDTGGDLS
jgi:hypothetical protein